MRPKTLIWCDLNDEQARLEREFGNDCVSIKGSTEEKKRIEYLRKWELEDIPVFISKPKIFGFGLNLQFCNNMVFVGLSDSFEAFYQAVRRCWRFGQKRPVNVHIIISEKEGNVLDNIKAKEARAEQMQKKMIECMADISRKEINNTSNQTIEYKPKKKMEVPAWMLSDKKMAKTG